jgi:uncharacterized protein HemX
MRINVLALALIIAGCLVLGAACGAGVALVFANQDRQELQAERDEAVQELQETELCWQKAEAVLRREQAELDRLRRLVRRDTREATRQERVLLRQFELEHERRVNELLTLQREAEQQRLRQESMKKVDTRR